ncbi:nucleoside-diphosphate kinase [Enterococcus devriesei]|uniref:nucleoside-diphosphate kinase n=1 Tax=Enterococcus devriesei TaxID=319970 RepID=UPI0028AA1878|nr:nucleoside-diphosphate kinase [Enterococcus devriesei]
MEQTLVIIKPDGVRRKLVGKIIQRFEERGLIIKKIQQKTLEQSLIREHYVHLKDKPFFDELVDYMTSGPAIVIILEQKNVIQIVRKMIGATNASEAEPGTIRGDFAIGTTENVVHASDSLESAEIEIRRFFPV